MIAVAGSLPGLQGKLALKQLAEASTRAVTPPVESGKL
jgi:hypothetical protein